VTDAVISQVAVEALVSGTPELAVSQVSVEAVVSGTPALRVSQVILEILAEVAYPAYLDFNTAISIGAYPTIQDGSCVLLELQGYDPVSDSVKTLYLSTCGFVSRPTDTPASLGFTERLLLAPVFQQDGSGRMGYGEVKISAAGTDWWRWDFALRPATLYYGFKNQAFSEFDAVRGLVVESAGAIFETPIVMRLGLTTKLALLQKPFYPYPVLADGRNYPAYLGACRNVRPELVDGNTLTYTVAPLAIGGFLAIYDMGLELTPGTEYTADAATGAFTLATPPAGAVTCDINGIIFPDISFAGFGLEGVPIDNVATMLYALAVYSGYLGESDFNAGNLIGAYTTWPQKMCLGLPSGGEETTISELIGPVLDSLELGVRVNRSGQLELYQNAAPTGDAGMQIATYGPDDIIQNSLRLVNTVPPLKSLRLGYNRNFSPLDRESVSPLLSESAKDLLLQEYEYQAGQNAITDYLAAEDAAVTTALTSEPEAYSETLRRLAARLAPVPIFEFIAIRNARQVQIGDEIELSAPGFGFENGRFMRITGVTWLENGAVRLRGRI
jgi:hypothetical protein